MRWQDGQAVPMETVVGDDASSINSQGSDEPFPYYWDVEDEDADIPAKTQIYHNLRWVGERLLAGIDVVGGAIGDFLGLTQPRWAYIQELHERAERDEAERAAAEAARLAQLREAEAAAVREAALKEAQDVEAGQAGTDETVATAAGAGAGAGAGVASASESSGDSAEASTS